MEEIHNQQHPVRVQPHLMIVCGLPGSGKSTAARILTDRTGSILLRSDLIRKELFPSPEYTSAERESVYVEMFDQAGDWLSKNNSVILDATFSKQRHREVAARLARQFHVDFLIIEITCTDARKIADRLGSRTNDISSADIEVYQREKNMFEPIVAPHLSVDNCGTVQELASQLTQYVTMMGS